jgi:hypothetical protein
MKDTRTQDFRLRRFEVSIMGWGSGIYLATTRGKALADAWRCDAFSGYTFGEFLKIAVCRLTDYQVEPVEITVSGRRAFYITHDSQYVTFVRPGGEFTLVAHPFDVLPEQFRPRAYRGSRAA